MPIVRLARAILFRLFYGVLSLVFITFVAFLADELAPGDLATVLAGEKGNSPKVVQQLRHDLGLDRPMLIRYADYLVKTAQGDFGQSFRPTKGTVAELLKQNLPMTLRIAFMALLLAIVVGISLGTLAAVYENRATDRLVLVFSTLGVTIPNFVLAPILVYFFSVQLGYVPQNWEPNLRAPLFLYLILPVFVLSLRPMTTLTRLTRASMIETMKQEFIKLAIAKGVGTNRLIFCHALRNAILPVVTQLGTNFGFLLTGSFVVERFFTLPGIGRIGIEAIQDGDMPVVQATILVTGAMFILINLIVDLLLPIIDPRIRERAI
jgi:peptide/nickel transport system permease protein